MNKLSHSSSSIYQDCPKKWDLHYNERLRSKHQSAALLFGSAIDIGITAILKPSEKTAEQTFTDIWTNQEINNVNSYLPSSTIIIYANSDFDFDLLDKEALTAIQNKFQIVDVEEEIKKVYHEKDYVSFEGLPEDRKIFLNFVNWWSMKRKGFLMLEAFRNDILPNIEEVLEIQAPTSLENDQGDKVVGFADIVCKYKGYLNPVVLDWKTSSIEYDKDAVLTSPQLTLYVHSLFEKYKTRTAGYGILYKRVEKNKKKKCSKCKKDGTGQRHKVCDAIIDDERCNGEWIERINPKIRTQIIINDIPIQTEEIVIENYDYINDSIKNNVFPRSFSSCRKPWGLCQYFKLCYEGKDDSLIKVEKKKE